MVQWVMLGDAKNHYFHQIVKERTVKGRIDSLINEHGETMDDEKEIEK